MATNKAECMAAQYRDEFTSLSANGAKTIKVRVSDACKTWKTRPAEFRLPVKYGLYESGYIDPDNADRWTKV